MFNNLANDIRNWGGAVNGGGFALSNVSALTVTTTITANGIATIGSGANPVLVKQLASNGAIKVWDAAVSNPKEIAFGFNAGATFTRGEIQVIQQGVSAMPLVLQPSGGTVGIGAATTPAAAFHVLANVSNEIARFQPSAASANSRGYISLYSTNPAYWWELSDEDAAGNGTANGLAFRERSGSGSSVVRLYLPQGGGMQIPGLPVHADNAAATGAGLAAGRLYRTSTGVLMIVY